MDSNSVLFSLSLGITFPISFCTSASTSVITQSTWYIVGIVSENMFVFQPYFFTFLLGVIPFVEEMLRRGTAVILCANSKPILNDVTYVELVLLLQQVRICHECINTVLFEFSFSKLFFKKYKSFVCEYLVYKN